MRGLEKPEIRPHLLDWMDLCRSIPLVVKNGSGHVVVLRSAMREALHRRKYFAEQFGRRAMGGRLTNRQQTLNPEALSVDIERLGDSVGQEKHGITRLEDDLQRFIGNAGGEQSPGGFR